VFLAHCPMLNAGILVPFTTSALTLPVPFSTPGFRGPSLRSVALPTQVCSPSLCFHPCGTDHGDKDPLGNRNLLLHDIKNVGRDGVSLGSKLFWITGFTHKAYWKAASSLPPTIVLIRSTGGRRLRLPPGRRVQVVVC
jgi:hypothetical protein